MTKLLNLDDIELDSQRKVVYKKVEYAVHDFTVQEFIQFQKHFRAFGAAYNSDDIEDMNRVVTEAQAIVKLGIPEFDPELIKNLNPLQIMALVSMIAGLVPDADEETQEAMEKKDQQEGPTE